MFELSTTAGAAYAGPVKGVAYSQTSGSTKAATSRRVADDDRAAATIRIPLRSEHSRIGPGQIPDGGRQLSVVKAGSEFVKSSLACIREGALEAVRFQANVEPDRASQLLGNTGE